jgi:hypothetical protein
MAKKVKFEFKPSDYVAGVRFKSKTQKTRVMGQISDFVLTKVLQDVGSAKSPVTGRKFKRLSKDYALKKAGDVGNSRPNLELDGDMLDSLTVVHKSGALSLEVGSGLQNSKADGHNNHSGQSSLPRRAFIPDEGRNEDFRPAIRDGIARIINRAVKAEDGKEN